MNTLDMRPHLTPVRPRPPSGPDRPHRATRLLAAVVAIALLLIGVALGRATAHRQATAPLTPTRPDAGASSQAPQHTAAGAVAAALEDLALTSSRGYITDPAERVRVVTAIAVPDQRAELLRNVSRPAAPTGVFAAAAAQVSVSAWRLIPVGYRVDDRGDSATVRVWSVQLSAAVGASPVPATAQWATSTLPLRWTSDGWRLDFDHASSDPGPVPGTSGQEQSSDLDLIAADHQFTPIAQMSGARR